MIDQPGRSSERDALMYLIAFDTLTIGHGMLGAREHDDDDEELEKWKDELLNNTMWPCVLRLLPMPHSDSAHVDGSVSYPYDVHRTGDVVRWTALHGVCGSKPSGYY